MPRPPRGREPPDLAAGSHSIAVGTRPPGGTLRMSDGAYGGSDGTTFTRPVGTRLEVTCRLSGHHEGRAILVFDGTTTSVICQMPRAKKCVPGVKNPFDDCP
jgi:hypothetical protein